MDNRLLLAISAALLLAAPVGTVQAAETDALGPVATTAQDATCAPPCGWINPLIALDFPDKQLCRSYPDDCQAPPAAGEELVFEGLFRWYWEMSEEGTYVDDPTTDIVVSFGGTSSNPTWLDVKVEPESFAITTADLFTPSYLIVDDSNPTAPRIWYEYPVPLKVTFTIAGEPSERDLQRLEDRGGLQSFFLKAKSTASSDRFKEAFGVEEFRFDAYHEESGIMDAGGSDGEDAPGLPIMAVGALLAAAAVVARRRS